MHGRQPRRASRDMAVTLPGAVMQPQGGMPDERTQLALSTYRNEQLLNLSPVEVIHKLYDVAIMACKKNDKALAQKALRELTVSLNFEHQEMSLGLYKLYDYCKRCIRSGDTEEAVTILQELRSSWADAFHLRP